MRFVRPFCRLTLFATTAVAALVLLTPATVSPARAQTAQAAPVAQSPVPSDETKDNAKDNAKSPATTGTGTIASVDQASPPAPKSLTAKAIDKVKQVAKTAGDIFGRV